MCHMHGKKYPLEKILKMMIQCCGIGYPSGLLCKTAVCNICLIPDNLKSEP